MPMQQLLIFDVLPLHMFESLWVRHLQVSLRGKEKIPASNSFRGEEIPDVLSEEHVDPVTTHRPKWRSVSSVNMAAAPQRGLTSHLSF